MNALKDTSNNIITRRIHAVIRGSLAQFANSGSESASWISQNGRMSDILGISDLLQGTADAASTTALLQNSLLHSVRVLEYKNDFPIALGVSISCCPVREMTRCGSGYAFSCLPNHVNCTPLELYTNEACTEDSLNWRLHYPEYNVNNLETHGVLNVSGESFVFVSKKHPVIDLLRVNKDILNADIDTHALIDDQWLKITKQVMHTCCTQLKSKVLSKVGTCDLNSLSLQISRLDGAEWIDISQNDELFSLLPPHVTTARPQPTHFENEEEKNRYNAAQIQRQEQLQQEQNALHSKHFSFHCRLELQYEVMPVHV